MFAPPHGPRASNCPRPDVRRRPSRMETGSRVATDRPAAVVGSPAIRRTREPGTEPTMRAAGHLPADLVATKRRENESSAARHRRPQGRRRPAPHPDGREHSRLVGGMCPARHRVGFRAGETSHGTEPDHAALPRSPRSEGLRTSRADRGHQAGHNPGRSHPEVLIQNCRAEDPGRIRAASRRLGASCRTPAWR